MSIEERAHLAATVAVVGDDDVKLQFSPAPTHTTLNAVFDGEHVLDVDLGADLKILRITVLEASRRLPAATATRRRGGFNAVQDDEKDALVLEFRPGAAQRSAELESDGITINGEQAMDLLWG